MTQASRIIQTACTDIHVTETSGRGLPILMLHGSGADSTVFEPQMRSTLGDLHRLIAIDLPGHGASGDAHDPATGYTLTGLAQCVADVVRALRVERFAVFGWSLGGHVAMELLYHADGIVGLMITGAPPVPRGTLGMLRAFHANWDMLLASKERYSARDVARYARLCYGDAPPPELVDAIRRTDGRMRPVFSRSMMRGDGADQKQTVETTTIPVAIVNGENDPFIRSSYFGGLHIPTLWGERVLRIAGAGHAAFRDNPDRFNALLLRFVSDLDVWHELEPAIARRA